MGAQGRQSHRVVFVRGRKTALIQGEVATAGANPCIVQGGLFPHPTLEFAHTSAQKRIHTYA